MPSPFVGPGRTGTDPHLQPSIDRLGASPPENGDHNPDATNQAGTDQALADSRATVRHLTTQNDALHEENEELRASSNTFGELAERLSRQLREECTNRPGPVRKYSGQAEIGWNDLAPRFPSMAPSLKQFTPARHL